MLLQVNNLTGGYHNKTVVHDITFQAGTGDMIYVLGANGSGKTTLFNMLVGYLPCKHGQILLNGQELHHYSRRDIARQIAYIPQNDTASFNYTALDMVLMGRIVHMPTFGTPSTQDREIAEQTMELLRIDHLGDREYLELSGGERQLVLIARALCQQAQCIIMDEPFSGLDFPNKSMVVHTLNRLIANDYSIIVSTHHTIEHYVDHAKILLIDKLGHSTFGTIDEIVENDSIQQAYDVPMQVIHKKDEEGGKYILCLPKSP